VLISEGVDLIILETFGDLSEMGEAIRAVKDVSNLPVIAQMTINSDGTSLYGTGPEIFTARLEEWGADIIGLNCSVGPHDMLDTLKKMSRYTSLPLSIQPNAGKARTIEGRVFYLASPDYFAKYTHRFIQEGARVVGGCCGTTPEHIRAMSSVVRMYRKNPRKIAVSTNVKETEESAGTFGETLPVKEKSLLGAKLAAGEKIYSLELTPPRGWELEKILSRAKKAKEGGFDAVNLPDGPRASARVGVTAVAVKIAEEIGIEPIIHYACRDRSLLGMQSDLLGAFALGLRNLLIITGDPPVLGDYPKSTPVFDVDSIGLTNLARFLNRGLDVGHHPIGKPTGFLIGVGINPAAVNPELELERFYWKVDAGAEFAVSQPVFDTDQLFAFLDRAEEVLRSKGLGMIPVLGGVWPLASLKNAEFLRNEVPGVSVPDSVIQRMAAAAEVSDERAEGVALAKEMMEVMFPRVAGFQISSPFGRIAPALELIGFAKELEQTGKIKI
jgi:homocysteine S-methyltransferase